MAHITALIASWADLQETIDVEELDTPSNRLVQWTKGQVKQRFENRGSSQPAICCPRLPAISVPDLVIEMNDDRNNDVALFHHNSLSPLWLARRMLAQKDFSVVGRCEVFDTYFLVKQGKLVCLPASRPLLEDDRQRFDQDPEAARYMVSSYACTAPAAVGAGDFMVIPAYTLYNLVVEEDALVVTGHIVPHREDAGMFIQP